MKHASRLKPRRLNAFKGGDVATPIRAMTDDLYKGSCKPNIIENMQIKKTETKRKKEENQKT